MDLKNKGRIRLTAFALACAVNTAGFTSYAMAPQENRMTVYESPSLDTEFRENPVSQEMAGQVTEAARQIAKEEREQRIQQLEEEARRKAEEEARRKAEEEEKKKAEEEARKKAEEEAARQEAEEAAARETAAQVQSDDQRLLAALIFCEAGNQPYEGQVAVGAVVMNRVNSGIYPGTIREVIYQPGQFGPAMTGWLDSVLSSGGYTDSAMQAAADALAGSNPVGGCLYFGNGNYGLKIGDHYFH